jgi:gamma-glutamyl hydrolase
MNALLCVCAAFSATERPIVAVLTQPGAWCAEKECGIGNQPSAWSPQLIYASYVKWIEASGARVTPLHADWPFDQVEALMRNVNGLLIPGGSNIYRPMNSTFANQTRRIYNLAVSMNVDEHDYFPVWGTCQGFDQLMIYGSSDEWSASIFATVDAEQLFLPLKFRDSISTSFLLENTPSHILSTLSQQNCTANFHYWGLTPQAFDADPKLSAAYTVLATSYDRHGKEFVALVEGTVLPFFGSQFHSEKTAFEWSMGLDPSAQSAEAIMAMQWFGLRFVAAAKKCTHTFKSSTAELASLIANHPPAFTGARGGAGVAGQTYIY